MSAFGVGLVVVAAVGAVAVVAGAVLRKAVNAYGKMCFKKGAIAAREKDGGPSNETIDPDTGENVHATAEDLDEEARKIASEQIKSMVMMYGMYLGIAAFISKLTTTVDKAYAKITRLGQAVESLKNSPSRAVREIVYVVKEGK